MDTIKQLVKNNIVAFGVVISIAWIASSFVLAKGIGNLKQNNTISVTGTAEKIVESDAGKWTFSITKTASPDQYLYVSKQIHEAGENALKYLTKNGIDAKGVTLQPLVSNVVCASQNQTTYDYSGHQQCSGTFTYSLTQQVIVESGDVNLIHNLALNSTTALTINDVQIQTVSVDYFYTKLADLRVSLLSEASKNAKERAKAIAESTGDSIGSVKEASQGVFQVTQRNSTEVSDSGSYDTSTIEKKVTGIVRASFAVN